MSPNPFILVSPASRGLSLALTRQFLRTTNLPVYASHRLAGNPKDIKEHILAPLKDVNPERLRLLNIELTSEDSIATAAESLAKSLKDESDDLSYIHTAFITGGVLYPEKQPSDIDFKRLQETFQVNVLSHLLMIKHFSRFLPSQHPQVEIKDLSKWVHVTARVGSIADNKRGGWYSYRSSKAALNQVVKTFDLQLQMNRRKAMCIAVHPGTVKTSLSKDYLGAADPKEVFEPEESAAKLVEVVKNLKENQRGMIWDYAGKEIPW
ncbi:NAD(P)-binding protein [Pluteus cervinus]|uniref:NAD(P)-binding protein n=1 Tax=Pluteus cervinus TaxID=181527 RepID=A0ACD3BEY6_9AGAR|nr:NAD(P)-binding protein [Pluteus cervinus]